MVSQTCAGLEYSMARTGEQAVHSMYELTLEMWRPLLLLMPWAWLYYISATTANSGDEFRHPLYYMWHHYTLSHVIFWGGWQAGKSLPRHFQGQLGQPNGCPHNLRHPETSGFPPKQLLLLGGSGWNRWPCLNIQGSKTGWFHQGAMHLSYPARQVPRSRIDCFVPPWCAPFLNNVHSLRFWHGWWAPVYLES